MIIKSPTRPGTTGEFNPVAGRPIIVGGIVVLVATSLYDGSSKYMTAAESPEIKGALGLSVSYWQLLWLLDAESVAIISL